MKRLYRTKSTFASLYSGPAPGTSASCDWRSDKISGQIMI